MSGEKRTYSDTMPMSRAELDAALRAHGYLNVAEIPEEYPTRCPPCPRCSDEALAMDINDEVPDNSAQDSCPVCHGSGGVTSDERRAYLESQER